MLTRALVLVGLCGCGGSQQPRTDAAHDEAEHHEELPEAVRSFHDVLSPLWHSEAGPDRTERTCAAVPSLRERAEGVRFAPPPPAAESDSAGWQTSADALFESVGALETECAVEGRPAFEARFSEVHDAFHALAARAGAAH